MEVTKIIGADICRDGGSYSFSFESADKSWYEFFVKIKGIGSKEYYEPTIYREGYNDGELVQKLTWSEANEFLQPIKYENPRFKELMILVGNSGKNT